MRTRVPSLKCEKGFTLMELVIVMTVMAILLAMALPVYVTHVKRACGASRAAFA